MRERGRHPVAWGTMTTAGAVVGVVGVGFVVADGSDFVSHWYLTTGRTLIDRSWPTDEVVSDIITATAGLSFGFFLGGAQAVSIAQSFGVRVLWASTCGVSSMFAFAAGSLLDGRPWDVVAAAGLSDESAGAAYWLPALMVFSSTVLLLYALPTGLVLWHLQKRARLAQSNVLISRFD